MTVVVFSDLRLWGSGYTLDDDRSTLNTNKYFDLKPKSPKKRKENPIGEDTRKGVWIPLTKKIVHIISVAGNKEHDISTNYRLRMSIFTVKSICLRYDNMTPNTSNSKTENK